MSVSAASSKFAAVISPVDARSKSDVADRLCAVRTTSPALSRLLFSTKALACVRMMFWARAPAPLTATPATPAKEAARDAAAEMALMVAASSASRSILPVEVKF